VLLEVPTSDDDWSQFSFNLRSEIDRINSAILTQKNVSLPTYPLDPIPWHDIYQWLAYVSQAHTAFNNVLGLPSQDLLSVNLQDVRQRSAWVWQQFSEVRDAEAALGI
jgi:hypothetical protein